LHFCKWSCHAYPEIADLRRAVYIQALTKNYRYQIGLWEPEYFNLQLADGTLVKNISSSYLKKKIEEDKNISASKNQIEKEFLIIRLIRKLFDSSLLSSDPRKSKWLS